MGKMWNLWHGCTKKSAGCANCYVYRSDAKYNRDPTQIYKTKSFGLITRKNKKGEYHIKSGEMIYTCFSSDFFVEEADEWRKEAWSMIRERKDLFFFFITKRIDRFYVSLPDDWASGYPHVSIGVTVENQQEVDYRLPIFIKLPIQHKVIINEPLLEDIDMSKYLDDSIIQVVVGGESGEKARNCNYQWILNIRQQCINKNINFFFKQTGAKFMKNGTLFHVPRRLQHSQANKAEINHIVKKSIFNMNLILSKKN